MMLLLPSFSSTFSAAFVLALLVANQWVDARGFAGKSASEAGTEVGAESKEGAVRTDGPKSMAMSINLREGAENMPVISEEEKGVGKCTKYECINRSDAVVTCKKFAKAQSCDIGKFECSTRTCICCCT